MKTEAIKLQVKQVGLVTAGFMGANAITKIAPIQNEKIKAIIPLLIGLGVAVVSKNNNLKVVGAGVASYGLLKTVRTVVMGSDPTGTNGIGGIADNPTVQKMLNMLLPNLGDLENNFNSYEEFYQAPIVDVPFESIEGIKEDFNNSSSNSQNLIEETSLLGYDLPYSNEMYI